MERIVNSRHNQFDLLPDGVVISIFNKVLDAKSLCRCYMVSKRFASLVLCVQNVSVTVPRNIPYFIVEEQTPVSDFLARLKDLMSLDLQLPVLHHEDLRASVCPLLYWNGTRLTASISEEDPEMAWLSQLKWKIARFDNNIESFILFTAESLIRSELSLNCEEEGEEEVEDDDNDYFGIDDFGIDEEEEGEEDDDDVDRSVMDSLLDLSKVFLNHACERFFILLSVLKNNQKLQNVTVGDSKKQGKICVSGEQLAKLRDLAMSKSLTPPGPGAVIPSKCFYTNIYHVPLLQLPKSRYEIEDATLVLVRRAYDEPMATRSTYYGEGDILAGSFDGDDEGVYGEAVERIVKKHKSRMLLLSIEEIP